MMAGIPNEVAMRCSDPHRLGALLLRERMADSIRIAEDVLTVSTQRPGVLYEKLPSWLADCDVHVSEMHSADESLQALFNSLMKMHRGEL